MTARTDHAVIVDMVAPGARVLDVGCGDGALLELLQRQKSVLGRGMEITPEGVAACMARGLSVVQGDADSDLADYPNDAFDYVILSKAIQQLRRPPHVLRELLRIGSRTIVSFPNVGHWRARLRLMMSGRIPTAANGAPTRWSDSDTLHLCTIRDFAELAQDLGMLVERAVPISAQEAGAPFARSLWAANWRAEEAVFLLARA